MDIRQLRYFVAIAESGSITRAAQTLNVAQPSLSFNLRTMEERLGVSLLFRTSQGVQLTEAGAILLRNAREIIARFDETEIEVRGSGVEPAGEVRIGLPSSIAQVLGVPLVLAARTELPKVKLRVAEAMSGYVLDWLRGNRVDLGLLYEVVEDRNLRSVALLTEGLVLFGPPAAGAGEALPEPGRAVPFGVVQGLPLILPSPGHGLRNLLERKGQSDEVKLRPDIEMDAYGGIRSLVLQGLGFSVLPHHSIREDVAAGRLRAWPFDPPLLRSVHLVSPTDRPLSAATRAVDTLCRRTLRDLVRSGAWSSGHMRITVPDAERP